MTTASNASFRYRCFLLRAAAGVSVLVIGLVSQACNRTDQDPSRPPEKVTLALASPPYTHLADIAQANGYFRQEGLEVTPRFHSTGKAALDEVLAGEVNFATVAETPIMFAVMKGESIFIIATIQSSNRTNAILARKDKGVRSAKDLKGKRIAVPLGTNGEFFLDAFLTARGIERKDVTVVDMKPEEMPEALVNGGVDAVSLFPPYLIQAQQKLGDNGLICYDEDLYMQTFNIVATQEQVRKSPVTVEKILRALIRAEAFVLRNPAEAQKIAAEFRQMDRALLGAMWGGNTFGVTLDQSLVLALEDESRWAAKGGLTGNRKVPNYLDLIYFDGLKAVKPEALRILR